MPREMENAAGKCDGKRKIAIFTSYVRPSFYGRRSLQLCDLHLFFIAKPIVRTSCTRLERRTYALLRSLTCSAAADKSGFIHSIQSAMKNEKKSSANFRWVARAAGNRMSIDPEWQEVAAQPYGQRIRSLEHRLAVRPDDRLAFETSMEWLRLARFRAAVGDSVRALRAYIEAADCCFDGCWYDYGDYHLPGVALRERFRDILAEAERVCGEDPRLLRLLRTHPQLRLAARWLRRSLDR